MTSINKAHFSELSIGFIDAPRSEAALSGPKKPVLIPTHVTPEKEDVSENVCCLVLFCENHKRLAIKKNNSKGLFLPHISFRSNDSWRSVSSFLVKTTVDRMGTDTISVSTTNIELIDMFRVQLPKTKQFCTRVTVLTRLINNMLSKSSNFKQSSLQSTNSNSTSTQNKKEFEKVSSAISGNSCYCHVNNSSFVWMGIEDLNYNFSTKFWGPEALLFYNSIQEANQEKYEMKKNYCDFSIKDSLKILSKKNLSREKKLLVEAKYNKGVLLKLFNEFVTHCFPSRYMTFNSFKVFLNKANWHAEDVIFQMIFKALNYRNTNFLSFEEFLLGLAVMDIETPHSGPIMEIRLEYIFRFYDSDCDNLISLAEFVRMTNDIIIKNKDNGMVKCNNSSDVAKKMITMFTNSIESLKGASNESNKIGLTLEHFQEMIATNMAFCELTSHIFRAPFCLMLHISTKMTYASSKIQENSLLQSFGYMVAKNQKICPICRRIKFNISAHCIKISSDNGEITDMINLELFQLQEKEKTPFMVEVNSSDCTNLAYDIMNRINKIGMSTFHFFANSDKTTNVFPEDKTLIKHWYFLNKQQHIEAMKKILCQAKELFAKENRILYIKSPCYVISGLYGNLKDLMIYSQFLWKISPIVNKATYVFLGNFSDYQPWSIECIIYLLCMKIIAPCRFIILRGYSEVRDNQKTVNLLYNICCREYKQELWNLINDVFDHLPLGVVIEDQIFCSSSGYPRSKKSIHGLNGSLPHCLPNPMENECVKEIL